MWAVVSTTPLDPSPRVNLLRLITSLGARLVQLSGTGSPSVVTLLSTKHLVSSILLSLCSALIISLPAAADDVENEPLDVFSGILGLALPLNSVIASTLRAGDPVGADGATWASNLFGMDGAPTSRFISFLLERPGSTAIPSLLGVGRHPSSYIPDPSKVHYSTIVSEDNGALFWKISVTAITVYVDGERREVDISPSTGGSAFPTAVLDTGVPVILMTSTIANGIYGALDIHPAQDRNCEPLRSPLPNSRITRVFRLRPMRNPSQHDHLC